MPDHADEGWEERMDLDGDRLPSVIPVHSMPRVVSAVSQRHLGGIQHIIEFENGYTSSVVRFPHSYGGAEGLWELAVIHEGELVYDTPVTNDVIGYLHSEELPEILMQVAALPPRTKEL